MIKEVYKKGGKKEKFDLTKVKRTLTSALERTDFPPEKKDEIVEVVSNKLLEFLKERREAFTSEIEAKILLELEKLSPQAVQNWREFRQQKDKKPS